MRVLTLFVYLLCYCYVVINELTQRAGLFAEARDVEGYSCVLVGVDSSALTAERARDYAQMVRKTAEALQPSKQVRSRQNNSEH